MILSFFALWFYSCSSSSTSHDGESDPEPADVNPDDAPADSAGEDSYDLDGEGDPLDTLPEQDGDGDTAEDFGEQEDVYVDLPDYCRAWEGLYDINLLQALHAHLHETYEPIEARENTAGELDRYTTARFFMFTEVEWVIMHESCCDGIECVYTGTFIAVASGDEPHHSVFNCEHTWPRSFMDPDRDSLLFSHQESDIHALYATLPEVNSARGSFHFGEPVSDLDTFTNPEDGTQFAVVGLNGEGERVFQPRAERQGDVSRGMFYFSVRWGKDISEAEEDVLRSWYDVDPVDERERRRNGIIFIIQGNLNPFVDCPDIIDRIDDFVAFDILDTNDNLPPP